MYSQWSMPRIHYLTCCILLLFQWTRFTSVDWGTCLRLRELQRLFFLLSLLFSALKVIFYFPLYASIEIIIRSFMCVPFDSLEQTLVKFCPMRAASTCPLLFLSFFILVFCVIASLFTCLYFAHFFPMLLLSFSVFLLLHWLNRLSEHNNFRSFYHFKYPIPFW